MSLPAVLADNPRLDRWLSFATPGKVELATGRVELGQGVLTAMTQIAAEELDVATERIVIRSGDTDRTPNEGYTAGSQSMQGAALRSVRLARKCGRCFSRPPRGGLAARWTRSPCATAVSRKTAQRRHGIIGRWRPR